jgi:hypothetical protein
MCKKIILGVITFKDSTFASIIHVAVFLQGNSPG